MRLYHGNPSNRGTIERPTDGYRLRVRAANCQRGWRASGPPKVYLRQAGIDAHRVECGMPQDGLQLEQVAAVTREGESKRMAKAVRVNVGHTGALAARKT